MNSSSRWLHVLVIVLVVIVENYYVSCLRSSAFMPSFGSISRTNIRIRNGRFLLSNRMNVRLFGTSESRKRPNKYYYTSAYPGTLCEIEIGDISLARKAWKKRRRSKSPLLTPVSIMGMNENDKVKKNIIYLILKYGIAEGRGNSGISLGCERMVSFYKDTFRKEIMDEASELGLSSTLSLLEHVFEDSGDGVRLLSTPSDILLHIPSLSRLRARDLASQVVLIQVTGGGNHTGNILLKNEAVPLGAALRLTRKENVDASNIYEDLSQHQRIKANVLRFVPRGDDGFPLLILGRDIISNSSFLPTRKPRRPLDIVHKPQFLLKDLNVGTSYDAIVKSVSLRSNAAFVDIGVGRPRVSHLGGFVRVLGMLRFDDLLKEKNEKSEHIDISSLVSRGDKLKVYVSRVFPQSSRFMVSLSPPFSDVKPFQVKILNNANKRLEKLAPYLPIIHELKDSECQGKIQAKSKTGDWYYIQPLLKDLPVGITNTPNLGESFEKGDEVRIRINGIDETRGQLSLILLGK